MLAADGARRPPDEGGNVRRHAVRERRRRDHEAGQLKVAATGKTARVTWSCGTGRAPSTLQFTIKPDGTFKALSNTGSLTVWSFIGRFMSATKARAMLHLNAICDGKGGTLNLPLKT